MKINKVFAAIASAALSFSAIAAMAISANAEEIKIASISDNSAVRFVDDTSKQVVKDIYNTSFADNNIISADTQVKDYVTVNFTINGIGTKDHNDNDDLSTEKYVAHLAGKVAGKDITVTDINTKEITGDGAYSLKFEFSGSQGTIEQLYIDTNILASQFKDEQMTITITDILTDQETTTTTSTTTTTTTTTTTSTASAGNSTTASTTTSNTTAAPTGDAGVGVAVAVAALAGTAAFVARKKD